jgi:serine phosphatase RsbU (regulator of sigma subunit)/pSer/pThr/pTyr-binding forkhead associated (FHA) protein
MPALVLFKSPSGGTPGDPIPLDGELFVIGRDAETCQIVIPHHAVSRKHAQIIRQKGQYYIEDLKSRNHTFVNNAEITARTQLKPEDRIKICDFVFRFLDDKKPRPDLPDWMRPEKPEEEEDSGGMTTIEATSGTKNVHTFLEVQPKDRILALYEISLGLTKTLELDTLLDQIAQTMFGTFKQADRTFVLLFDESGRAVPKVVKNRRPGVDDARFSKTIVKKTLDSLQAYLSEDASSDASLGPAASIAEFKIRSVMCVPLATADGKPLGAIQLDTQDRAKKFKEDDLKLLTIVSHLASVAIEKARLHETLLRRENERKEIELARAVQLGFLPQTLPEVEGYEFFSHYSPAQTVGGDYYDFIQIPGGRVAVVLGDVAGKGVPAALLVAKLSSEVRFCLLTEPNPARAISLLNEQMIRGGMGDRFVTLAVAVIDPVAHRLTVVNAGHMSPKLLRACRGELTEAISNEVTGLPIGVMPGYEYESATLGMEPGDMVTIYTDGVTDAMSPSGELFGQQSVDRFLAPDESSLPENWRPKRTGERLVQAVRRHASGRPQNDDIAIVCFGRLDPAHGPPTSGTHRTQPVRVGG